MICNDIHHSEDFKLYEKFKSECSSPSESLCELCVKELALARQRKQVRKPGEVTDEMASELGAKLSCAHVCTWSDVLSTMPPERVGTEEGEAEINEAVAAAEWRVLRDWLLEHKLELRRSTIEK